MIIQTFFTVYKVEINSALDLKFTCSILKFVIGFALLIVLLSAVVTIVTTLSMSAICSNGEVKGGICET